MPEVRVDLVVAAGPVGCVALLVCPLAESATRLGYDIVPTRDHLREGIAASEARCISFDRNKSGVQIVMDTGEDSIFLW